MVHPGRQFYEDWAGRQAEDTARATILKWKAVNLANLYLRTLKGTTVRSLCEIGGAEGTIVHTVGDILGVERRVNYELTATFCRIGRDLYPEVEFINSEFTGREPEPFDLMVCSDILEHVEDERDFLAAVGRSCRYALFKIPVEKCLIGTDPWFWLHGQGKPAKYRYGPGHYNGHLRGYTVGQAHACLAPAFRLLDAQLSSVTYFYGSPLERQVERLLGVRATVWLFGGAVFALGESRSHPSEGQVA